MRGREANKINEDARGGEKRLLLLSIMTVMVAVLAFRYQRLDVSRRRFIKHMVGQLPYLPGRYCA